MKTDPAEKLRRLLGAPGAHGDRSHLGYQGSWPAFREGFWEGYAAGRAEIVTTYNAVLAWLTVREPQAARLLEQLRRRMNLNPNQSMETRMEYPKQPAHYPPLNLRVVAYLPSGRGPVAYYAVTEEVHAEQLERSRAAHLARTRELLGELYVEAEALAGWIAADHAWQALRSGGPLAELVKAAAADVDSPGTPFTAAFVTNETGAVVWTSWPPDDPGEIVLEPGPVEGGPPPTSRD